MEEIKSKYIIRKFKERSGKQRDLKFEEIDINFYKPSAKCVSFITDEHRILYWIMALQLRYYEHLKDSDQFFIKWIDHHDDTLEYFKEVEIKIYKTPPPDDNTCAEPKGNQDESSPEESGYNLLITVHIYLTTGVIMLQGSSYKFWGEKEFPILQEIVSHSFNLGREADSTRVNDVGSDPSNVCSAVQKSLFAEDKLLYENLLELQNQLLEKKKSKPVKSKTTKKAKESIQKVSESSTSIPETPVRRNRRNSFESTRSLSSFTKSSTSISELRFTVSNLESELIELKNSLNSQSSLSLLQDKISFLTDKITQLDNTMKVNTQSLTDRVIELENENAQWKKKYNLVKSQLSEVKKKQEVSMENLNEKIKEQFDKCEFFSEFEKQQEEKFNSLSENVQAQMKSKETKPNSIPVNNDTQTKSIESTASSPVQDWAMQEQHQSLLTLNTHNRFGVLESDDLHEHSWFSEPYAPRQVLPGVPPVNDQNPQEKQGHHGLRVDHNIVLLIDSNGKYIETRKVSPNSKKIFCPTIRAVKQAISENDIGNPSHIVIHVGTNDLEHIPVDACAAQLKDVIQMASKKFQSSKIIVSSVLKRSDEGDQLRSQLNSQLGRISALYPNVQVVNNENIPKEFLYDNKHLRRNKVGALVSNLKDAIFNRVKTTKNGGRQGRRNARPSTQSKSDQRFQNHPTSSMNVQPKQSPARRTYAQVTSTTLNPPEVPHHQPEPAAPNMLDMNTVLGLLKLYQSMRTN